ncbi:DUF4199 domain-containing protein [Spirosoma jeollabukense]
MNEQPSAARIALKWGFLTALVELLVTSIRYALNQYVNFLFPVLTVLILAAGTVLAMREFRQQNKGWMTYGESISLTLLLFAIIGIMDSTYQQVYQTYIDPAYTEKTLSQTRDMMERFGAKDEQLEQFDEQVEDAGNKPKKGMAGISFIGSILFWVFGGFLMSLIIGAFMRKTKTNPFE